jgi:MIF4G domain
MFSPTSSPLADNRIGELLLQIYFQDFDTISAQVVVWINARRHSTEMINEIVDIIYRTATSQHYISPGPMARLCRELYRRIRPQTPGGIDGGTFLESLLDRCTQGISEVREVLDCSGEAWVYQMGSWPQFIALIRFIGELFKMELLEEEVLTEFCIKGVFCDAKLSDLKVEGFCAILKIVGSLLDEGTTRGDLDRYIRSLHEYGKSHCIPPALTSLLNVRRVQNVLIITTHTSQEVDVLRSNNWIALPREAEHVCYPNPFPNSPPSSLFSLASLSDIYQESSSQGLDDESVPRTSPTISSISDITITDSEPGDAKSRSSSARYSVPNYADSYSNNTRTPLSQHNKFYFEDGNLLIVCEGTVFRVHTTVLSLNSPIIREKLSPRNIALAGRVRGSPCLYFPDSAHEFATLLNVLYDPG